MKIIPLSLVLALLGLTAKAQELPPASYLTKGGATLRTNCSACHTVNDQSKLSVPAGSSSAGVENGTVPEIAAIKGIIDDPACPFVAIMGTNSKPAHDITEDTQIDLNHPGGSLSDFVAFLREQDPTANIVISPAAVNLPIPKLQLKKVTVPRVLEILQIAMMGEPRALNVTPVDGSLVLTAIDGEATKPAPTTVRSFSLSNLPPSELEHIFSLIGRAFEMTNSQPPDMQFHKETETLLANVDSNQDKILRELVERIKQARVPTEPSRDQLQTKLERCIIKIEKTRQNYIKHAESLSKREGAEVELGEPSPETKLLKIEANLLLNELDRLYKTRQLLASQLEDLK